tara:strand:- start:18 stop:350 length:333 start_codon:yes stop_codon:yes gene_type:complete
MTSSATQTTTVTQTDPDDPTSVSATIYLGASQNDGLVEGGYMGNIDEFPGFTTEIMPVDSNGDDLVVDALVVIDALTEIDVITEDTVTIEIETTVDVVEQSTATATRLVP